MILTLLLAVALTAAVMAAAGLARENRLIRRDSAAREGLRAEQYTYLLTQWRERLTAAEAAHVAEVERLVNLRIAGTLDRVEPSTFIEPTPESAVAGRIVEDMHAVRVAAKQEETVQRAMADLREQYRVHGVTMTDEQLRDEATAILLASGVYGFRAEIEPPVAGVAR